jgi:hypothetical protein
MSDTNHHLNCAANDQVMRDIAEKIANSSGQAIVGPVTHQGRAGVGDTEK